MGETYKLMDGSVFDDTNMELHNCTFPLVGTAAMMCTQSAKEMAPGDIGLQTDILVFSVIAYVEAFKARYAITVDADKAAKLEKALEAALVWKLQGAASNAKLLATARQTGITEDELRSYVGMFPLCDLNGNLESLEPDVASRCQREYIAICLWLSRNVLASVMRRGFQAFPLHQVMIAFGPKMTRFYEAFRYMVDEAKI